MKQLEFSVVVIGGGAAGMCAALRAKEKMKGRVAILECDETLGGNSVFAPMPQSSEYVRPESEQTEAYLSRMQQHNWKTDARIVSTFHSSSRRAFSWLEKRIQVSEGNLTGQLESRCREAGIEILTSTRARQLIKDERGWMCAVLAEQDKVPVLIGTRVVILACGGFLGDSELMQKYFPLYDDTLSKDVVLQGKPASGDGVRLALVAGAGDDQTATFVIAPDAMPFSPIAIPPMTAILTNQARTPEALWINNVGVRFVNEAEPHAFQAIYRQPHKEFFAVFDRGVLEELELRNPAFSLKALDAEMELLMDADQGVVTDKVGALTAWVGGKTHIVFHTLERYNECCEKGYDFLFGKPSQALLAFHKPPFYAFRLGLAVRGTQGPVRTNPMMAVVDRLDAPVPALLACGADVAGLYPGGFVGSDGTDSIAWAIISGFIAGEHAAGFENGMGPAAPCIFPKFTARQILANQYHNVGVAPPNFAVLGGIMTLREDGSRILTHVAESPEKQGLLGPMPTPPPTEDD